MSINAIKQEIKTFSANRKSLVAKDRGRYVLIRKDEIIDIFDSEDEGITAGYERFGNVPFLVKEILEVDRVGVIGILQRTYA